MANTKPKTIEDHLAELRAIAARLAPRLPHATVNQSICLRTGDERVETTTQISLTARAKPEHLKVLLSLYDEGSARFDHLKAVYFASEHTYMYGTILGRTVYVAEPRAMFVEAGLCEAATTAEPVAAPVGGGL